MFGHPRPPIPHMRWGYNNRPPQNHQWRHPGGPRGPFRGHQRFNHPRPPLPFGSDNYWCETCDRGFPTEDILNKHKQQHQKCNIDGCQFIAHPKVITKHIQMQHSTGLYKKIANLKNPEDIEKWREERKRRYPTKANIDKKAAELKEKINRGEKMGLERNRNRFNNRNSDQDNRPGQGIKRKFTTRNENQPQSKLKRNNPINNHNKNQLKPKPIPALFVIEDHRLKPFTGIQNLQMDSDNEIENDTPELNDLIEDEDHCDEAKSEIVEKITEKAEPVVCGALSSLMCDYGSSEEEDNNATLKTNSKVIIQQSKTNQQNSKCNLVTTVTAENNSIKVKRGYTEDNKVSINLKEMGPNQPTHDKAEQDKDKISSKLENEDVDKQVRITSPSDVNGLIQNDNSKDSGLVVITRQPSTLEGSGNICGDKIKEASVQATNNNDDSDSGPEEIKAEVRKEDTLVLEESKAKPTNVRKKITKERMQVNQRRRPKLPSTLLQKLLHKEMQQERNIVLQCIRYVKQNNYFDKQE